MIKNIIILTLIILIILFYILIFFKKNWNKNKNINNYYYKLCNNNNINNVYKDVFNNNPIIFFLKNNDQIKILKTIKSIKYKIPGKILNVSARRQKPLYYKLLIKEKIYNFWRYPDFANEIRRHTKLFMDNYMKYFFVNYLQNNKNLICEFTSYHGILDNKIRLWKQLVKMYGREDASTVMPECYIIPEDYNIFINNYKKSAGKFICKNALKGAKTGLLVTDDYDEIIDIFRKYSKFNSEECIDNSCLGKIEYNVVQHYLKKPFLIKDYKFNFRFFLVIFWYNNKLYWGVYKDFALSYSKNKYSENVKDTNSVITSGIIETVDDTLKMNRPYNSETFFKYMKVNHSDFSRNKFINKLKNIFYKIFNSNKEDLSSYCTENGKQFQVYAIDSEMTMEYDIKVYEANIYFAIFHNIIGKTQATLYEDIFNNLNLIDSFNYGFWRK